MAIKDEAKAKEKEVVYYGRYTIHACTNYLGPNISSSTQNHCKASYLCPIGWMQREKGKSLGKRKVREERCDGGRPGLAAGDSVGLRGDSED
eukprot:306858-Hanusia_phi.AAC.1